MGVSMRLPVGGLDSRWAGYPLPLLERLRQAAREEPRSDTAMRPLSTVAQHGQGSLDAIIWHEQPHAAHPALHGHANTDDDSGYASPLQRDPRQIGLYRRWITLDRLHRTGSMRGEAGFYLMPYPIARARETAAKVARPCEDTHFSR